MYIFYSKVYAVDRCKDRFLIMANMLRKYGVKNVDTFHMDALSFTLFDNVEYILIDPSCSGSGNCKLVLLFNDFVYIYMMKCLQ